MAKSAYGALVDQCIIYTLPRFFNYLSTHHILGDLFAINHTVCIIVVDDGVIGINKI